MPHHDLIINARFFYPRDSDDPRVIAVVDDLADILLIGGKQKQRNILKYLLLDFRLRQLELPNGWLICSRDRSSNTNFYNATEPYVSLGVTYDPLVSILDKLKPGYIEEELGANFVDETYMTRVRPTDELLAYICRIPEELVRNADEVAQPIVLKEKRWVTNRKGIAKPIKRRVKFEPTELTRQIAGFVRSINCKYMECRIDLYNPFHFDLESALPTGFKKSQINVNLNHKYIYRSFNNDFDHGGRFYGGWWQGIPSHLRPYVLIDETPTVEIDFKGFHIALLYSIAGIDYYGEDPHRDPYAIAGWDRDDVKPLLQIMLNTPRERVAQAYNKDRSKQGGDQFPLERLEALITEFETMHSPIQSYFYQNWGVRLQNIDSLIATYVLTACMNTGIRDRSGSGLSNHFPVFPVHDSFIVPTQHKDQLIEAMNQGVVDALMALDYDDVMLMRQYRQVVKIGRTIDLDGLRRDESFYERVTLHQEGKTLPELKIFKRSNKRLGIDLFCLG